MNATRHVGLEQLLGLRDGEPEAGVADHVAHCERCASELDRLHQTAALLRALPVRRPARDRWPAIRAAALAERRRRGWWRVGQAAAALAATVTLVVGVRATRAGNAPDSLVVASDRVSDSELALLMERSQELEAALRAIGPEGRVLNGRAANAVVQLEDEIALVDQRLAVAGRTANRDAEFVHLWQQRVDLLDALVGVHVTRTASVGF